MPKPDPQDERMALADKIEAWLAGSFYKPGDMPSSSMQASIGGLVCQHMPMILAALRAQPERAAADMRERVEATLTEWTRPSAIRLMVGEMMTAQEGRTADAVAMMLAAKVRRALPLSPAGEGGSDA